MKIEDIPENNFSQYNNFPQNNFSSNKNAIPDKKNQINYDNILKNMGMKEIKGKLFWDNKNKNQVDDNFIEYDPQQRKKQIPTQQQTTNIQCQTPTYDNSYIHNKYFKNENNNIPKIQRPKNLIEYRNMLIKRIIEKKELKKLNLVKCFSTK